VSEKRNAYKVLVTKPERKISLEIRKRRWRIKLKWILKRTGKESVAWAHLFLTGAGGGLL
jgi:hypothetical protein